MPRFSKNIANLRSSEIRDLMSLATDPNMISFAGVCLAMNFPNRVSGWAMPPLTERKTSGHAIWTHNWAPTLLESLSDYLESKGLPVRNNRLIITTGSLRHTYSSKVLSIAILCLWKRQFHWSSFACAVRLN